MNVYILQGGDSFKIGKANNVKKRISNIQVSCPFPVSLIAIKATENAEEVEREIHRFLNNYRVSGEWYNLDKYMLQGIIKKYNFQSKGKYHISKLTNKKHSQITWLIDGFPQYGFGSDKKLYNLKTGRVIRKVVKGYTTGFNLNGKFYSLQKIKPLLRKPEPYCPF